MNKRPRQYKGSEKRPSESSYSKYSYQELTDMMISQAKRLNTRLSALEKANMRTGYAYTEARKYMWDKRQYMGDQERPRFSRSKYVYEEKNGKRVRGRMRTREEIIEQLADMTKWESYTTSTVSGMMAMYEAKYENVKNQGFTGSFEDYVELRTNEAFETIAKYYGYETAYVIVENNEEKAVNAFIEAHPEFFRKDNPLDNQGSILESEFSSWYEANWEDTSGITDEELGITG